MKYQIIVPETKQVLSNPDEKHIIRALADLMWFSEFAKEQGFQSLQIVKCK